jgi:hypothetical protein
MKKVIYKPRGLDALNVVPVIKEPLSKTLDGFQATPKTLDFLHCLFHRHVRNASETRTHSDSRGSIRKRKRRGTPDAHTYTHESISQA